MSLKRSQLDRMTCEDPGCDHGARTGHELVMGARCHPRAGTVATYLNGTVTIECNECGKLVCEVAVAP